MTDYDKDLLQWYLKAFMVTTAFLALIFWAGTARAQEIDRLQGWDIWEATGYCACKKCTGKSPGDRGYGITASGLEAEVGMVAINWLPFGTRINIMTKDGILTSSVGIMDYNSVFVVMDRGAKSIFGDKKHHKKRLDIYFNNHQQALNWGRQKVGVKILTIKRGRK